MLSALAHALVFLIGGLPGGEPRVLEPAELLEVALVDLPPAAPPSAPRAAEDGSEPPAVAVPESRIVPMPEAGVELPSEDARFLSDRDNVVAEEMVRRGESLDRAGPGESESASAENDRSDSAAEAADLLPGRDRDQGQASVADEPPLVAAAPPAPAVAQREPSDRLPPIRTGDSGDNERPAERAIALADLMPRPGDLAAVPHGSEFPAERRAPATPARGARNLMPGRRLRFSSGSGIAAALPSVRDGDVTLLNTKAHEFAPFVRRVATRVFQHLQIELFAAVRRQVSGSGEEQALVRATMSADGRFLHAELVENRSDTRLAVPRMLLGVVGPRTFFDDNPPPGAVAEDGLIHFELTIHLRVWSEDRYDPSSSRRAPLTQFEGYFGTGLR